MSSPVRRSAHRKHTLICCPHPSCHMTEYSLTVGRACKHLPVISKYHGLNNYLYIYLYIIKVPVIYNHLSTYAFLYLLLWHADPEYPSKQLHPPVIRLQIPAAEHSADWCARSTLYALSTHATPRGQSRMEQSAEPASHPFQQLHVFRLQLPWPEQSLGHEQCTSLASVSKASKKRCIWNATK